MSNPLTFAFMTLIAVALVAVFGALFGGSSEPHPPADTVSAEELTLLAEIRELKRRRALEKAGAR
jgi:hypothetical protein